MKLSQLFKTWINIVRSFGSITKTITAAMIEQAMIDQKIELDATIDQYLPLNQLDTYPTVRQLLTHTSGYPSQYLKLSILWNIMNEDNAYYKVGRDSVLQDIESHEVGSLPDDYDYANFNYAVLGLILEEIYEDKFIHLVDAYLQDLGLNQPSISTNNYDFNHYESFTEDDAYLAAGQVTSNASDMMKYIQLQLDREHTVLEENITTYSESKHIGYAWHVHEDGIFWHNGATTHFNAFVAFHGESQQGVVVLINLPVNEGVTATEIGHQILLDEIKTDSDSN